MKKDNKISTENDNSKVSNTETDFSNLAENLKILVVNHMVTPPLPDNIFKCTLENKEVIHQRLLHNRNLLQIALNNRLPFRRIERIIYPTPIEFKRLHRTIKSLYENRKDKKYSVSPLIRQKGHKIEMGIKRKILLWAMKTHQ